MIGSADNVKINVDNTRKNEKSEGFDYALQLTRLLLIPCGIWPVKFSSPIQRILRPFLILACWFVMLFLLIPVCLFMLFIVRDMRIRIKLLGPLGFSLMSLFKYAVVITRSHEIEKCIEDILDDWQRVTTVDDRNTMVENARTGRVLTMVCMFLMYGGGMPYVTIVPLAKGATIIGNVSYRSLAYPSYFIFFNPNIRPIYDIVFLTQCLCGLTRYTITCGVYSIVLVCVMHICSQISITSSMLQNLAAGYDKKLVGRVVTNHLKFLNFAAKLDKIFKEIFLVEVMGSTAVICLLGYYFITITFYALQEYEQRESITTITYFFLLMSFVFNIFILCYIGQVLTEKCESIAKAAYATKWYQLSGKEARSIGFIVSYNHRPVTLTAGKLLKLSLNSFSSIIKASAGYLNILRTVATNAT